MPDLPTELLSSSSTFSRRTLLAGAAGVAGLAVVAAACGSSGGDAGSTATTTGDLNLLSIFPPQGLIVTGSQQRMPFTLADAQGAPLDHVPASLEFLVQKPDGGRLGDPITVRRHDQGIPRAYFPLVVQFPETGDYQITAKVNGTRLEPRAVTVSKPSDVAVPQPGDAMIPVDTPTTANAEGVDPICTRSPACDLHHVTLTQALGSGKPVALMIATPAYCQTAICGPVLDVLLGQEHAFPDVQMVHAEVYKNPTAVDNIADADLAPVIDAYHLSYEPVLFLANADGTIATRLDTIFDKTEVEAALRTLS
jgi:hypothetical protein